ncbi:MAG: hypothetical protein HOW73_23470 [Polyangiaceae bacterium]|nr:hypothetical protein [Polyangiaceae bacterium]
MHVFERLKIAVARLERPHALAAFFTVLTIVVPSLLVVGPWLVERGTYGFHDWDVQTSHRYLAMRSLSEYGEWPGWNPYACGGFPAWGYVESATNVVSPFLPFYWLFDIRTAIRLEVLGMALLGAAGTFAVAGRFTRSLGGRALVVALFAVNGRWALQTAAGHTWHLAYAILPWAFWAFERAREPKLSTPHFIGLAAAFAMLVYSGGIYPLPHTVLVLGAWAVLVAIQDRSLRGLVVLGGAGLAGVGLAAPKLLPMLATFDRAPRIIDSDEWLGVDAFYTLLTSRDQGFFDRPAAVAPYGWHEWGMYVSLPGVVSIAAAFLFATGRRELLLKLMGGALVVLGFGAFHAWAPWTLVHAHLPVFRSQHVPSRFLYPAVLVLGLVAASGAGALVERAARRFQYADAVVAALALALACDIAIVGRKPMSEAMHLRSPSIEPEASFHFESRAPLQYRPRDWAPPMYLAMLANTGVIHCYGVPPFDEQGAVAKEDRSYRGEVYVDPSGEAEIVSWSPNAARIAVRGAPSGARLVYNMNFDRGWAAVVEAGGMKEAGRITPDRHRVSVALPEGDSVVDLGYRPPGMRAGVVLFLLTTCGLGALVVVARRRASRGMPE